MQQYDIIIIGGGMVGASLACALRDTPLSIALIDAAPLSTQDDPRLIALNYHSYSLFEELHIWPNLAPFAAAIQQVHVSDRGHFGKVRINANDMGLSALGYVVPAKHINAALNETLNTQKNVKIFRPAKLKSLAQTDSTATLGIETAAADILLEGTLIIGADGSHSTVRELLGITTHTVDYQQSAIVTVTTLQRPHKNIAYERFHPQGAIAMLPLVGQQCATIWSDKTATVQELMQLDDEAFLQRLQHNFGYRLGKLIGVAKRHVYPLQMLQSDQQIKQHVILIGNALHTLNPIAAQGLNLALTEISMLAKNIIAQTETLATPNWQQYLAWQQQQQSASTKLSHQLPRLFSQNSTLLNIARQIGMVGLDICPPLKRRFAWRALHLKN
jgi:2-octaprenyl-6-methoxyphenol hydroxylase